MARRHRKSRIPTPNSPITGHGPSPGSAGYDAFGFPSFAKGSKSRRHGFFNKMLKNAPPFMGDMTMYNTAISHINDILARNGQLPPEILQRSQAAIEAQRQNTQREWQARAAAAGIDPNSMQYQTIQQGIDQSHDQAQQNERFNQAQAAEQRKREDLNLVNPYMQMLMGYTAPKGRNSQITPAPVGSAPKTDWAGIGAQLGSAYIRGAAPSEATGGQWNWGL